MIRFVESDFERLRTYLASYTLGRDLGSKAKEDLVKRAHKHSLAALQVWAVVDLLAKSDKLVLSGTRVISESEQMAQIGECFSDLTSCLFAGLHGLYKPANMSMRSGVETLVRGLAGLSSKEAAKTTSVYRLFEVARAQPPFRDAAAPFLSNLQQDYSELCLYTHSATSAHLTRNFALANFPRHDTAKLRQLVRQLERIVKAALAILILANRDLYLKVPSRARDLLDDIMPISVRLFALGGAN